MLQVCYLPFQLPLSCSLIYTQPTGAVISEDNQALATMQTSDILDRMNQPLSSRNVQKVQTQAPQVSMPGVPALPMPTGELATLWDPRQNEEFDLDAFLSDGV